MKKIFITIFTVACLTALLAGCGSKTTDGEKDTNAGEGVYTYTQDEILTNNSLENLLERHSSLSFIRKYVNEKGETVSVIRGQYTMPNGQLQMQMSQNEDEDSMSYIEHGYADENYHGAVYATSGDGKKYVTLFADAEDYENALAAMWLADADTSGNTEVLDTSVQGESVIVAIRTDYRDEADMYDITNYYIDPESNDLLSMESTTYSTEDDSVVVKVETTITYDEPMEFKDDPFETITNSADYCEVNLIINPQQENMEVYWYPIAHDANVIFASSDEYTLYADETLTQEIDPIGVNISGEACNIYVVPKQG